MNSKDSETRDALVFGFDYKHKPESWHHSLTPLKQEVMPRLKHLDAILVRAA